MSPVDDTFITGSLDESVRLWDLRSPSCLGIMHVQGKPVVSFDPEGLVFAVGVGSEAVKLYDLRSYDKGPFATFKMPRETKCEWTGLRFSPHGKFILLATNGGVMRLLDAFDGHPMQTFAGHLNNRGVPIEGGFTPDSRFVISGSTDGRIHAWNAETGFKVRLYRPCSNVDRGLNTLSSSGLCAERRPHRPGAVRPVQPLLHDDGLGLCPP